MGQEVLAFFVLIFKKMRLTIKARDRSFFMSHKFGMKGNFHKKNPKNVLRNGNIIRKTCVASQSDHVEKDNP